MKKTAAWLAVHALEQLGVHRSFCMSGTHNTDLYDELNNSAAIGAGLAQPGKEVFSG